MPSESRTHSVRKITGERRASPNSLKAIGPDGLSKGSAREALLHAEIRSSLRSQDVPSHRILVVDVNFHFPFVAFRNRLQKASKRARQIARTA